MVRSVGCAIRPAVATFRAGMEEVPIPCNGFVRDPLSGS